jgi:hypothetical protein
MCDSLGAMRSVRAQDGQATTDYVALVALLALLLVVGAGIAGVAAPGLVNAVVGQLRHALCVVSGGSCPLAPSGPCTVASMRDARHVGVNLWLVRLDDDRVLLRERLSDGTFHLTVSTREAGGIEAGIGAKAQIKTDPRGRPIGVDRELRAGAQGVLGHGSVYYARGEREADRLLRAIRADRAPRASEVFYEGGIRGLGRAEQSAARALYGHRDGRGEALIGARPDRRSGTLTRSPAAGGSGAAHASLAGGGDAGSLDGLTVLGLTLDRGRRPVELSLSAKGTAAAGDSLPVGVARALGPAGGNASSTSAGRRWEVGARADLRDPAVAAAWRSFRAAPASWSAIRALGEQLRARATVEVRSYRLDSSSTGAGARLGAGLKLGGEYEHATDRALLLAAATKPPWGLWEPRLDCVRVA